MAGNPIADPGPQQGDESASAAVPGAVPADAPVERFGVLEVRRLSKDDGRSLLLFARREDRGAVSETRFNELRGEPVVYAIHRQGRTFLPDRAHCPLCPTNPGGPQTELPLERFELAVFDNRFPAFEPPGGAAEVVVYSDDHDTSLGRLGADRVEALVWVWRHRYLELGAREDVEYVYIFENRGVEVGVTLHHPHGQIYGYPFLPPVPALELAADARLGACAPCAVLERELAGPRLLHEDEHVAIYVPEAARWPFEAHISMREHRPSLGDCEPPEMRALAEALRLLARGYDALFDRPMPYVMAVHQAPTGARDAGGHLHVEFYPPLRTADKLKFPAGSEQGAGTFISDVMPEDAAERLREAIARVR